MSRRFNRNVFNPSSSIAKRNSDDDERIEQNEEIERLSDQFKKVRNKNNADGDAGKSKSGHAENGDAHEHMDNDVEMTASQGTSKDRRAHRNVHVDEDEVSNSDDHNDHETDENANDEGTSRFGRLPPGFPFSRLVNFNAFGSSGESRSSTARPVDSQAIAQTMAQFFPEASGFLNSLGEGGMRGVFGEPMGISRYLALLKKREDPYMLLDTLNELSESLLMTNTLSMGRSFPVDELVKSLIAILNDPSLADNLEIQLVSTRCLYNIWEIDPYFSVVLVLNGAIEAIQPKLMEIIDIDLAEQCLQTLEVISRNQGFSILNKGCLLACLQYLDFFATHAQRKALIIASNSCHAVGPSNFHHVKDVFPILSRVLIENSDMVMVENAVIAICGIIDSLDKEPALLESLINNNPMIVNKMCDLISVSHSKNSSQNTTTPIIPYSTAIKLLKSLEHLLAVSPDLSFELIKGFNINGFLSGGSSDSNSKESVSIESLMKCSKELVIGVLNIICALLPISLKSPDDPKNYFGYISTIDLKRKQINDARLGIYDKNDENRKTLTGFLHDTLALLINIFSSSVDVDIRRKVLIAITRLSEIPVFKECVFPKNVINATASVLTSVVIQGKNSFQKAGTEVTEQQPEVLALSSAQTASSNKQVNTLLMLLGSLSGIKVFSDFDTFLIEFKREGLIENFSSVLEFIETELRNLETDEDTDENSDDGRDSDASTRDDHRQSSSVRVRDYDEHSESNGDSEDEQIINDVDVDTSVEGDDDEQNSEDGEDENGSELDDDEDDDAESFEEHFYDRDERNFRIDSHRSNTLYLENANGTFKLKSFNRKQSLITIKAILQSLESKLAVTNTLVGAKSETKNMLTLRKVVEILSSQNLRTWVYNDWLELWKMFSGSLITGEFTISSFELTSSGVIDILNKIFTKGGVGEVGSLCWNTFVDIFINGQSNVGNEKMPLIVLIKTLQETLNRSESFEILTSGNSKVELSHSYANTSGGSSGASLSNTNKAIAMAGVINIRLLGDASDETIPEHYKSLVLTTHAIATFKSIHSFLRSRLMFAAQLSETLASTSENRRSNRSGFFSGANLFLRAGRRGLDEVIENDEQDSDEDTGDNTEDVNIDIADEDIGIDDDDDDDDIDGDDDDDVDNIDDDDVEFNPSTGIAREEIVEGEVTGGETSRRRSSGHSSSRGSFNGRRRSSGRKSMSREEDEWYIEFSVNDQVIPLESTIYGVAFSALKGKSSTSVVNTNDVWSEVHNIKYKRVTGKRPVMTSFDSKVSSSNYSTKTRSEDLDSLNDQMSINILKLLKTLFQINFSVENSMINQSLFMNYKLTAKLNKQLEEPLIAVSGLLPPWSIHITREFPFIFPINTRLFFLQSTSFGYSRLIQQWKSKAKDESSSGSSNNNYSVIAELGRQNRHKIKISRKYLLQSGIKLLDLYGNHSSVLEIEYFNEEGSGLGPTLEFYANISKQFCKKKLNLWRDENFGSETFVFNKKGLFPAPLNSNDSTKILHLFKILGKLLARSLLDGRLVDFAFNKTFFELAEMIDKFGSIQMSKSAMLETLKEVDTELYNSIMQLKKLFAAGELNSTDLALKFVLPGFENTYELLPNGSEIDINGDNFEDYIDAIVSATVKDGVSKQIESFIKGFSDVFPYNGITIFPPSELVTMFGNGEEDWSFETLYSSINANHGYTVDSISVIRLLEIMTELSTNERRTFLQFLTGSPRLPIGGFKALRPVFTVVRKPSENGLKPDDFLPSVMTCANYLKLPEYSSKEKMKLRILQAINEGSGAFLLS